MKTASLCKTSREYEYQSQADLDFSALENSNRICQSLILSSDRSNVKANTIKSASGPFGPKLTINRTGMNFGPAHNLCKKTKQSLDEYSTRNTMGDIYNI